MKAASLTGRGKRSPIVELLRSVNLNARGIAKEPARLSSAKADTNLSFVLED